VKHLLLVLERRKGSKLLLLDEVSGSSSEGRLEQAVLSRGVSQHGQVLLLLQVLTQYVLLLLLMQLRDQHRVPVVNAFSPAILSEGNWQKGRHICCMG
jgi:hypothetical protein